MSKAFTKEDDVDSTPLLPALVSPLPPGARNYLTAGGAQRLRGELERLSTRERPALVAAATGDSNTDAKLSLSQLDQRIAYLQRSLSSAEVVEPPAGPQDTVRFGATVTVRDARGTETVYRIVGVDEAAPEKNEVSWLSPIARALTNSRLGQRVPFRFPAGTTQLEIVAIRYE